MKWIVEAAKDKDKPIHFPEKLALELLDASENQGRVVKRKQDLHKQCEANRAYAHYRFVWFIQDEYYFVFPLIFIFVINRWS